MTVKLIVTTIFKLMNEENDRLYAYTGINE